MKILRDNVLLKEVLEVAEYMYARSDEVLRNAEDEKWMTVNKMRSAANDAVYYTSKAVASIPDESVVYELNSAKKFLFALQTMYIFASKQKYIMLDPNTVVKIDKILKKLDVSIDKNLKQIAINNYKEMPLKVLEN